MFKRKIRNPFLRAFAEWCVTIGAALILSLFLRTYVFRVADVSGHSMEPTLSSRDFVVLSKVRYWFDDPQAGDIIAFPFRGNPSELYIKRIWGVPGDVIDFQYYRFMVNGVVPDYEFAQIDIFSRGDVYFPFVVEEGEFFVMGDNMNSSKDSRHSVVGTVPQGDMLGRVVIRLWPPSRFGSVEP